MEIYQAVEVWDSKEREELEVDLFELEASTDVQRRIQEDLTDAKCLGEKNKLFIMAGKNDQNKIRVLVSSGSIIPDDVFAQSVFGLEEYLNLLSHYHNRLLQAGPQINFSMSVGCYSGDNCEQYHRAATQHGVSSAFNKFKLPNQLKKEDFKSVMRVADWITSLYHIMEILQEKIAIPFFEKLAPDVVNSEGKQYSCRFLPRLLFTKIKIVGGTEKINLPDRFTVQGKNSFYVLLCLRGIYSAYFRRTKCGNQSLGVSIEQGQFIAINSAEEAVTIMSSQEEGKALIFISDNYVSMRTGHGADITSCETNKIFYDLETLNTWKSSTPAIKALWSGFQLNFYAPGEQKTFSVPPCYLQLAKSLIAVELVTQSSNLLQSPKKTLIKKRILPENNDDSSKSEKIALGAAHFHGLLASSDVDKPPTVILSESKAQKRIIQSKNQNCLWQKLRGGMKDFIKTNLFGLGVKRKRDEVLLEEEEQQEVEEEEQEVEKKEKSPPNKRRRNLLSEFEQHGLFDESASENSETDRQEISFSLTRPGKIIDSVDLGDSPEIGKKVKGDFSELLRNNSSEESEGDVETEEETEKKKTAEVPDRQSEVEVIEITHDDKTESEMNSKKKKKIKKKKLKKVKKIPKNKTPKISPERKGREVLEFVKYHLLNQYYSLSKFKELDDWKDLSGEDFVKRYQASFAEQREINAQKVHEEKEVNEEDVDRSEEEVELNEEWLAKWNAKEGKSVGDKICDSSYTFNTSLYQLLHCTSLQIHASINDDNSINFDNEGLEWLYDEMAVRSGFGDEKGRSLLNKLDKARLTRFRESLAHLKRGALAVMGLALAKKRPDKPLRFNKHIYTTEKKLLPKTESVIRENFVSYTILNHYLSVGLFEELIPFIGLFTPLQEHLVSNAQKVHLVISHDDLLDVYRILTTERERQLIRETLPCLKNELEIIPKGLEEEEKTFPPRLLKDYEWVSQQLINRKVNICPVCVRVAAEEEKERKKAAMPVKKRGRPKKCRADEKQIEQEEDLRNDESDEKSNEEEENEGEIEDEEEEEEEEENNDNYNSDNEELDKSGDRLVIDTSNDDEDE